MAHTLSVTGSLKAEPNSGNPSGCPTTLSPIEEKISLSKAPITVEYELTDDAAQAVSFGGLTQANVVMIKSVGGKVRARLTSADGTDQAVPVDSFMLLFSSSVPFTALDITRVSGVSTTVKVLLGERT